MVITFLGTGTSQGVPVVGCTCDVCLSKNPKDYRLRSSVYVEVNGTKILIDTGPDLRLQLLQNQITAVDAILYTHEHKDHLCGLDDIRPIYFRQQKAMPLYALERVLKVVKKDFDYAFFTERYYGVPAFQLHEIQNTPFFIRDIKITPIHVIHDQLPILGYRIQNFAYITDASFIEDCEIEKLQNLDLMVINALRKEKHHSHLSLQEALHIIEQVKPKKAILTHISHELGLYEETNATLPHNVSLAYDTLQIEL